MREAILFGLFFLSFGCICGVLNPLDYPEPYLDNETIRNCIEEESFTTYIVGNETQTIDVKIISDSAQFCWVEFYHDGWRYSAGYDKDLGRLCRYEATAPGMKKSNSAACTELGGFFG